jgi:TolB-like protein/DNA-binding winged helix-turn-helix (wHTH) protein/Tfp pilus assembly protein PilF
MAGRFKVGEWTVVPELNSLEGNERTAHLEPKVMQVLVTLAEHPGQVVSKEQIFHRVWPGTFVSDEVLTRSVSELRKVFEDNPQDPRYIQTIPKGGYRLIAPIVLEAADRAVTPHVPWWKHEKWKLTTAATIILLASIASRYFVKERQQTSSRPQITSLAVLPLDNLSGDAGQDYFADGMTDELTTRLSNISALRVISRTSVMHYKGTKKTIPEIARELNVDAVLEGSVLRSGDKVRISSQLIQASTDKHLWAESYERDLRDVLALQGEVAGAVAEHVRAKLTPQERASLASSPTVNPEAYEAYLQGEYFWNQITEEGIKKSIEYFQKAIQLAPDYAPAYASLAFSYNLLASSEFAPPTENYSKARQLARQALEKDETLPAAHGALGFVLCYSDWNWPAAEAEFKRAIDLNPRSDTGRGDYALYLANMGRSEEAIAEMKKTLESDPLSVLGRWNLGWMYWTSGKLDPAIEQFQKILEIAPNSPDGHQGLGMVYVFENRHAEAIAELQKAVTLARDNVWFKAWLGYAYAAAGKRHAAHEVLDDLKQMSKRKYVSAYLVATVYAGLGDKNSAFRWLTTALEERNDLLIGLKVDPVFASFRSDPRFADLLRRIGLPR